MSSELRLLPAQTERVETGPVQFGDDWPGLFIRGDNALWLSMVLTCAISDLEEAGKSCPLSVLMPLRGLQQDLASVDARFHTRPAPQPVDDVCEHVYFGPFCFKCGTREA